MDYDFQILNAIQNDFKTARQISNEIQVPFERVGIRLKQLRKYDLVVVKQAENYTHQGPKPLLYKVKING